MQKTFREFEKLVFFDLWIPDSGFRIADSVFRIPDSGSGFRFRIADCGFRFRIPDSGFRFPGFRVAPQCVVIVFLVLLVKALTVSTMQDRQM